MRALTMMMVAMDGKVLPPESGGESAAAASRIPHAARRVAGGRVSCYRPAMSPAPAPVELSFRAGILHATVRASAVDSGNADRLCREIESGIESHGRRFRGLLVDMAAVGFMNSRGLAVCIDLARATGEAGGRAAVIGLSQDLVRMFSLMQVDRLLVPCGDEASARTYLLSGEGGAAAGGGAASSED